ncbi:MAG: ABC transporter permease [Verrucomicrobia bacterium]|nr:ABC transporter permease [Verrucomicrobiota bacterium]
MVLIFLALFFGYALLEAFERGFSTTLVNPVFLGQANLLNLTRSIGIFGIFSIAMGIVIITGGIDLSIGSVFALLGVIMAFLLGQPYNLSWPIAVVIIVALAMLIGLINGLLISRMALQPFVITLCGLLCYRGLARFLSQDQTVGFGGDTSYELLRTLATGVIFNVPAPFIVFLVVCVVMALVLHVSVYGRYLFAIGRNEEAALYSGINTKAIVTSAYVLCGFLTGISAILLGFYTNSISPASHGSFFELYAVAAAVLGGCSLRGSEGSVLGIFIGTAMIQLLRNIVNLQGIDSSLEFVVMGGVILIAVVFDQILAARRRAREARIDIKTVPELAVAGSQK